MIRQPVVVNVDVVVFFLIVVGAAFFFGYEFGALSVTEVIKIPIKPDQPCIKPAMLRKLTLDYVKEARNGR